MAPWLAGISGATVLASSLLVTYRTLRRRQATAGAATIRCTDPTGHQHDVEQALVAAADVPLIRWAGQELATLLYQLTPERITGTPAAVELSDTHGIELLWDTPNPGAPHPWETSDSGWAWRRAYDPDHQIPADPQPALLPGLVTIGKRDDNQILIDLEALGVLAITGDPTGAEDLVRAVILELAAGDQLSDSWIDLVGIDIDGIEHLERARTTTADVALQRLATTVEDYQRALHERQAHDSFQLRVGQRPGGRELTVIVTRTSIDGIEQLIAHAPARRGVALVVLGDMAESDGISTMTIDADGTAQLCPLGLTVRAAAVPRHSAAEVAVLLDHAATPAGDTDTDGYALEPASPSADAASPPAVPGGGEVDLTEAGEQLTNDDSDDGWQEPTFDYTVRLLGTPALPDHTLPNTELNVLTYLVCNGGHAGIDQTTNAVWAGRAIKRVTLWNKMSRLRQELGRDHIPDTTDETLRVTPSVGSDLQLFAVLAERANHVSSSAAITLLSRALDLIDGVPFDADSYDWAHEQQHHAHACEMIETAALRLVDLALDTDDPGTARHAVAQALRALPVNEPLYRARMRIEHHVGNTAGVRCAYTELASLLGDLDSTGTYQPSSRTNALLEQLVGN